MRHFDPVMQRMPLAGHRNSRADVKGPVMKGIRRWSPYTEQSRKFDIRTKTTREATDDGAGDWCRRPLNMLLGGTNALNRLIVDRLEALQRPPVGRMKEALLGKQECVRVPCRCFRSVWQGFEYA